MPTKHVGDCSRQEEPLNRIDPATLENPCSRSPFAPNRFEFPSSTASEHLTAGPTVMTRLIRGIVTETGHRVAQS